MKFLKSQSTSKYGIIDKTFQANQFGRYTMNGNGGLKLPSGPDDARPNPALINNLEGTIRFNTDTQTLEWYDGIRWTSSTGGSAYIDIDPPPNPSVGQLWWDSDEGEMFVYYFDGDSYQWVSTNAGQSYKAQTYIGDVPPILPSSGDFWWDSTDGQLYIYYDDGDSSQWVSATTGIAAGVDSVNGQSGEVTIKTINGNDIVGTGNLDIHLDGGTASSTY